MALPSNMPTIHPSLFYNLPDRLIDPPSRASPTVHTSNFPIANLDPTLHDQASPQGGKENVAPESPTTRSFSTTSSLNTLPTHTMSLPNSKCKARKDFSAKDIEVLLRGLIEVDPFMAGCNKVSLKWKEVTTRVQAEGYCVGRTADTLKNKVSALLTWVEGGKKTSAQSPFGRNTQKDLAWLAAMGGKLDAIANLKKCAKETKELEHDKVKHKQDITHVAGLAMRKAMMMGHANPTKRSASTSLSDSDDHANKENKIISTDLSGEGAPSKRARHASCREISKHLGSIVNFMGEHKKHLELEARHMEHQEGLQEQMVEIAERSVELQAKHQGDLLALLRETLTAPGPVGQGNV